MTRFLVILREHGGKPWHGTAGDRPIRVVFADSPEDAARLAFAEPPSALNVRDAWVVALAEPYRPVEVAIDVPKPTWGKSRPANPMDREPQVQVEGVEGVAV